MGPMGNYSFITRAKHAFFFSCPSFLLLHSMFGLLLSLTPFSLCGEVLLFNLSLSCPRKNQCTTKHSY